MSYAGKFIGFIGMMGTGKSTLAKALAQHLQAQAFIEPEAEHWPIPDGEPWENHVYALESWVRNTNYNHFMLAREAADKGACAVSDGGFFLLNRELMGTDCCDWYFSHLSADEYDRLLNQAIADWASAPAVDILVLLEADKATWLSFLKERGREMDENADMVKHYEALQHLIAAAATKFATERGIPLVRFVTTTAAPRQNMKLLLQSLPNIT